MHPRPALIIFLCAMALISVGLVMVYSASAGRAAETQLIRSLSQMERPDRDVLLSQITIHSSDFAQKQFYWAVLAVLGMFVAFQVGPRFFDRHAGLIMLLGLVGLAAVYVPGLGWEVNGSYRWVKVLGLRVQPSEFAKLAVILYFSWFLSHHLNQVRSFWRVFAPLYLLMGIACLLIVKEPDLGAAGMVFLACYTILMVAGTPKRYLLLGLIPVMGKVAYELTVEYRRNRLIAFIWPDLVDPKDTWQLNQSLTAVSTGGLHGLGLGNGPQKYNFLSEAHTDFIYAVIAEETGLIGAALVMTIYVVLTLTSLHVARRVFGSFEGLVATGIICITGIQAFINMFVVLGLLPTKGLTLPLVSYGGSSLVVSCFAVGLLMNIARTAELERQPASRALPMEVPV